MAVKSHIEIAPGLKVAAQMSPEPSDEEMAFVRQMGVEYAVTWIDSAKASPEYYRSRREHFARGGIQLYGLGNGSVHNVDAITLNLPNRDEKVAEYKAHIRNLGQADIPYTTYAHMANSVWSTPPEQTRGGSRARAFDMARLAEASGGGFTGEGLTHDREYSEEELWDNFASFAVEIAPVAEEAGVRIGIHPDDPPGVPLGGVPRPIFSSFDGYKRALKIADSPNVGMCLCIGLLAGRAARPWAATWWRRSATSAGRARYSRSTTATLTSRCRTLSKPLSTTDTSTCIRPCERWPKSRYDGTLIPDHIPQMGDDGRLGTAYTLAYMRALQKRAEEERS